MTSASMSSTQDSFTLCVNMALKLPDGSSLPSGRRPGQLIIDGTQAVLAALEQVSDRTLSRQGRSGRQRPLGDVIGVGVRQFEFSLEPGDHGAVLGQAALADRFDPIRHGSTGLCLDIALECRNCGIDG